MLQTPPLTPFGRALAGLRSLSRAELAVLAFAALGAGNLWARRGAGNVLIAPDGRQFIAGFSLIVVAAVLCFVAARRPAGAPRPAICAVALLAQVMVQPAFLFPSWLTYGTGLTLAAVPLIRNPRLAWGAVAVVAGLITVWAAQWLAVSAQIDVFAEVQGSTAALLHGQNPYGPVYPLYLDSPLHGAVFGAGSFDYGPAVILLSVPGRLLGDVRYTALALNVAILGAVLVWTRRWAALRQLGPAIAALWVASPFIPIMVLLEWTDTFAMAGFAWWLVLRDSHRRWAIVCLTLALASKPSMLPLMLPLLLWMRESWRELVWAMVGTVAIALPFALWTGVPQFVYDTIGLYGDLPTRRDSVNLNGLSSALGHGLLPGGVLLLGSVAVVAIFVARRPRDYGDLCALGAGLMIAICFFAKQAFMNYYYNAAIALLLAVGAGALQPSAGLDTPAANLARFVRGIPRPWRWRDQPLEGVTAYAEPSSTGASTT